MSGVALTPVISGLLIALPAAPAAAVPTPLQPTGGWVVNFADQQCLASRTFTLRNGDLALVVRPDPTGGGAQLILAPSNPADRHLFSRAETRLDGHAIRATSIATMPVSGGRLAYPIPLTAPEYARLLTTRTLSVRGGVGSFSIELAPAIQELGRLLAECNADLLASWGFTREQQALQARFPEPLTSVSTYVLQSDYPRVATRRAAVGEVQARVAVAADGTVSNCVVVRSSGDSALDQATCSAFVRRARMRPALNNAGQPMPSIFVFSKLWLFPRS
jgi:TonB family protein